MKKGIFVQNKIIFQEESCDRLEDSQIQGFESLVVPQNVDRTWSLIKDLGFVRHAL